MAAAIIALLLITGVAPLDAQASASGEVSVVYLVRHAERAQDDPRDPNLSPAGAARAEELRRVLEEVHLDRVLSTDYRRTLQTAGPVAADRGVEVVRYDPGDLEGLAAELRATPGRHLVVGHSNTTPELVTALGGDPGPPIHEGEYDRLYVVMVAADGSVASSLLRFGVPSPPDSGTSGRKP